MCVCVCVCEFARDVYAGVVTGVQGERHAWGVMDKGTDCPLAPRTTPREEEWTSFIFISKVGLL